MTQPERHWLDEGRHGPTPEEVAAALASCPGYETSPNPCRCPCYGCKHHCSAHQDPTPAPDGRRERYAEAIAAFGISYSVNACELAGVVLAVRDQELEQLRDQVARVREVHRSERDDWGGTECGECRVPYPCPTIRALGEQEQS